METGRAAERITQMLDRAVALLESESWDRRLSNMPEPAKAVADRAFWLGVILIGLLIGGLLLPRNVSK